MSLSHLVIEHRTTPDDAKESLEHAVADLEEHLGRFIKQTTWNETRSAVMLKGTGVVLDLRVDTMFLYVDGDIPALGKFLGKGVGKRLAEVLRLAVHKHFPRGIVEHK